MFIGLLSAVEKFFSFLEKEEEEEEAVFTLWNNV